MVGEKPPSGILPSIISSDVLGVPESAVQEYLVEGFMDDKACR